MENAFLSFRFGHWWYLFIACVVIVLSIYLSALKKRSQFDYSRFTKIIITTLCIALALCALLIVASLVFFGFGKDWVGNYTGILLIIGPLLIIGLVWYALAKEKSKK